MMRMVSQAKLKIKGGGLNITGTFTPLVRIEETIVPD